MIGLLLFPTKIRRKFCENYTGFCFWFWFLFSKKNILTEIFSKYVLGDLDVIMILPHFYHSVGSD